MTNYRKIEKLIVADGWMLVRVNGSHYQYKHPSNPNMITIPNHNGKDISIGVIKNLENTTGLSLRRSS